MVRRTAIALALVLGITSFAAGATEPGRRRPVTNPQLLVDGLIAAASADTLRVQTPSGTVTVSIDAATEIVRAGNRNAIDDSILGLYTLTEAVAARDGSFSARRVTLFDVPASAALEETVRIDGKVASVSPEASTLVLETRGGAITVGVNETTVIRLDGKPIRLADIAVGSAARVVGKPTGERTLLALEIDIRSTTQPPNHGAVAGEVVEIRDAEQALVIRRGMSGEHSAKDELTVVRTTASTEIYRKRERIRFADIAKGDFALALGEFDSAGALVAARIDVNEPPEPAPKIAGRVLEVSAATRSFTVAAERFSAAGGVDAPVTVIVNDATEIYRGRDRVRFDTIATGDFVHVAGEWNAEKALVASVIHITMPPIVPPMPLLLGEIADIEAATRTLVVRVRAMRPNETKTDGTVKVLVGDDATIFRNGEPSRFADLKVGEIVSVVGAVRDDGAVVATRVDVIVIPDKPAVIAGDVTAVGERSIEIIVPTLNPTLLPVKVTILVEESTEIYRDGERVRLPAIQVGDVLAAQGERKDENTFLARRIDARSKPMSPVAYVRGEVKSIDKGVLGVVDPDGQPWRIHVSPMTIIIRDGRPLRFDELVVGDLLDVIGLTKGEHEVAAVTIRVVR